MRLVIGSLAVVLMVASSAVQAQMDDFNERFGTVQGNILPAPGEQDLPRMVTVRLLGQGFQKVAFATAGRFYFSEVPAGNYVLVVSSEGRNESVLNLHGWSPQTSDPVISLVLGRRVAGGDVPRGSAVVSVQDLKIPEKAQREFHKGLDFLQKDELEKAEKHMSKAVQIYPDYYQAYNNLGVVAMKLDRVDEAEQNFEKAVEISPENLKAHKNLGYLRLAFGEPEEAISPLANAVRIDSEDPTAHSYLAEAYFLNQEVDRAKEHFKRALVLNPQLAYPNYRMGHISLEEKQYDQALNYFRKFLALNPAKGREEVEPIVAELEKHFKDVLASTPISRQD